MRDTQSAKTMPIRGEAEGYNAGMNTTSPSQIRIETIESEALQGNPLGDPHVRQLAVYLPPGYSSHQARYPCLYLLAGYAGSWRSYLNWQPWEEGLQQRLDRLILSGRARPMIVVLPDAFTRYGGSQYLNSTAIGRYQDFLLEIVTWVDKHFRTRPERQCRAIAGKSSGGFGAFHAVLRFPEIFGLLADHSGDKDFAKCYGTDLLKLPGLLERFDVSAVLADPYTFQPKDQAFFDLMNIAAMSAAYSPDPQAPLGFRWPVDPHTGQLVPEVWARWQSFDPLELAPQHKDVLNRLLLYYMDCGNRDEYFIHLGCRLLSRRLTQAGVRHVYEEFDGGHRHTTHRLDRSLEAISRALPD